MPGAQPVEPGPRVGLYVRAEQERVEDHVGAARGKAGDQLVAHLVDRDPASLGLRLLFVAEVAHEPLEVGCGGRAALAVQPQPGHGEEVAHEEAVVGERLARHHLVDAPGAGDDAQHAFGDHPGAKRRRVDVEHPAHHGRAFGEPGQRRGLPRDTARHGVALDGLRERGEDVADAVEVQQLGREAPVAAVVQAGPAHVGIVRRGDARQPEFDVVFAGERVTDLLPDLGPVPLEPGEQRGRLRGPGVCQHDRQVLLENPARPAPLFDHIGGAVVHRRHRGHERRALLIEQVDAVAVRRVTHADDVAAVDSGFLDGLVNGECRGLPDRIAVALHPGRPRITRARPCARPPPPRGRPGRRSPPLRR